MKMRAFSCLSALAVVSAAGILEPPDSKVHVLSFDNFDRFIKKHPIVVMEFYAPWCGHCQSLAPVYREAANLIVSADLPKRVVFAKFDDGDEYNRQLRAGDSDMFNYTSFPTILIFKDRKIKAANKEHWTRKYRGRRWQYYGGGRDKPEDFVFYLSAIANEKDPFDEERKMRPGFYKAGGKHETTHIVDLEPDGEVGFNSTILEDTRNTLWIVEFYSDRCPYCNSLAPEMAKAAEKLQTETNFRIRVAAVNSRVYDEIATAHEVTSWPWVTSFYHGSKVDDMAGLGGWESVYNWGNKMYKQAYSSNPPVNKFLQGPWASGWQDKTPEEIAAEQKAVEDKLEALIVKAVGLNIYSEKGVSVLRKKLAGGSRTLAQTISILEGKLRPSEELTEALPEVTGSEEQVVAELLDRAQGFNILTKKAAREMGDQPTDVVLVDLQHKLAPLHALHKPAHDEL